MNFNAPYLFDEAEIAAKNYPEELLPDLLWGTSPDNLRNAAESDVLSYLWDEVEDPAKITQIVPEGLPHIVIGPFVFVGSKRASKAA